MLINSWHFKHTASLKSDLTVWTQNVILDLQNYWESRIENLGWKRKNFPKISICSFKETTLISYLKLKQRTKCLTSNFVTQKPLFKYFNFTKDTAQIQPLSSFSDSKKNAITRLFTSKTCSSRSPLWEHICLKMHLNLCPKKPYSLLSLELEENFIPVYVN